MTAAAAAWIQLGLGLWLLTAPRGWSSRLAALGTIGWGLVVWVFGEAFGAIFAPGLSWLNGAPGAVVLYIVAGTLLALPPRAWAGQRLGRLLLGLTQPDWQAKMINGVALLSDYNALGVNLVAVLGLALAGAGILAGAGMPAPRALLRRDGWRWGPPRPRLLRATLLGATAFCLVVWVTIQDFGVPGGLTAASARVLSSGRNATAAGAFGMVLVGVVPLALVTGSPQADPLIARAIAGESMTVNRSAPDFRLVSQSGQPVSLASLRGTVTLLTFLDPRCVADCPVATELKEAGTRLGGADGQVRLVAIAASQLTTAWPTSGPSTAPKAWTPSRTGCSSPAPPRSCSGPGAATGSSSHTWHPARPAS